jgi:nucleotide-binding universal stress UspA family protein
MKHFKHILATTDLSPESFAAVSYAAHLARGQGARFSILHVPHSTSLAYTEFIPPIDMINIDATIERAARERLHGWVRRHLPEMRGVDVVLRSGITHEVICETAEELGASVIVIATHGRKGLGHLVLGSVVERVLREAPCPVLVVKPPKEAAATMRKRRVKAAKAARAKR